MVVYFCVTYYHVLCAILHRVTFESKSNAIIMISNNRPNHEALSMRLRNTNLFNDVIFFDNNTIIKKAMYMYKLQGCKGNISRIVKNICLDTEKTLKFDVNAVDRYYLMCDFQSFGIYLIHKKIKFHYFEDGCGMLSRRQSLMELFKSPLTIRLINDYSLLGENELIINKYANLLAQEKGFSDDKVIDFNVEKLLSEQTPETIKKILDAFGAKEVHTKSKRNALILTQAFIKKHKKSFEFQKYIYELLINYFCEDMEVYIKPHPLDVHSVYSKWFENSNIIDAQIPSDILKYCVRGKFDIGISIASSAIYSLNSCIKDIICFEDYAVSSLNNIHQLFSISKILELFKWSTYNIYTLEMDVSILKEIINKKTKIKNDILKIYEITEDIIYENTTPNVYIFKDPFLDIEELKRNYGINLKKDDVVFFINDGALLSQLECDNSSYNILKIEIIFSDKKSQEERVGIYTMSEKIKKVLTENQTINSRISNKLEVKIKNFSLISEDGKDVLIQHLLKQNRILLKKAKGNEDN